MKETKMMLGDARVEATVPVLDLELSRGFYEGKLGLDPAGAYVPDVEVLYGLAGGSTLLVYVHSTMIASAHTAANFIVADVRATVEALQERGVVFEEYDLPTLKTVDGVANVRGKDFAWFKDPDRNILGIHS
jgi:catechol 2,3-dioxygenase-like lactoylglutathione lyase family enzyme